MTVNMPCHLLVHWRQLGGEGLGVGQPPKQLKKYFCQNGERVFIRKM